MSEENQAEVTEDELTVLKDRATQMGIQFHPAIGLDKLRGKVNEALAGKTTEPEAEAPAKLTEAQQKNLAARALRKEAMKLIKVNISCMNPNKGEWDGEIFTTGNSVIGTIRRYVHFNTDWHVEQAILNMLLERQAQIFVTVKGRNGRKERKGKLIKEFTISYPEKMTQVELDKLAQRQAMASGTSDD
jgi:hypothetical protein